MKKTNKILSIILAVAMLLGMMPMTAFAATEALALKENSYTKVDYSNSATQYYQYNNYLYKVTYSNLKNITEVAIDYNAYNYLYLCYTKSDTGEGAVGHLLTSYRGSNAELSNLPTSSSKSVSFYTSNTTASNEKKNVVTITCLAVNAPAWTWDGTSSATAKFTSTDGNAFANVTATISQETVTEATTCQIKEQIKYTANVTFNGQTYANTKTVTGAAGPHSSVYSASENVVVETCSVCTNPIGTLTISAPADLYADGVTAKEAVIDNQLVEGTDYTVSYSTADGNAPKTEGTYTASVTVGGATASVEFTLLNYAAKVTDKDGNEIEGSPYKTFADAVTAASSSEGSKLTLLDDITLSSTQYIDAGKFTLDLNGKTLSSENDFALKIQSGTDVTIKDSGEGGTIESEIQNYHVIYNYGTLTVESGIIKGFGGIDNRGTLNFKNGKIEAGETNAIRNYGTAYVHNGVFAAFNEDVITNGSGSTIYIYDGQFVGASALHNYSQAYIEGGEFTGNDGAALKLIGGTLEVTGGSFTGTDNEDGSCTGVPYGEYTVYCSKNATITLKGGEFPNGFAVDYVTVNSLLAEGYAFYNKDGNKITVADDAQKIDGYVQVKDHYIVRVTDKDGNEIEGSPFKTLEEAADAVRWDYENATITLLDDITLDSTWSVGGVVTIDLNGKTLNCTSGDTIFVQAFNGFEVTVEDSSENKTGVIRSETGSAIDVGVGSKFILNSGTITAENDYAIMAVYSSSSNSLFEAHGGIVNGRVFCYADSVVTGGTFNDMFAVSYNYKQNKFSGGTFNGGITINSFDSLNDILADGYHYRNAQGNIVDGSSKIIEEKVTIEKGADFSADAVVTVEDVVYNGSAQEPDVTVTIGGKPLTEGKDYSIAFADNINAGTATVTVTSAGDYEGEIVKTFEIKKADSSIDVYPEANELTYNGEAQTLVVTGDSNNGSIVYSLDGEKYSPLAPTGTNAGEYTVYYKVIGDANHNDTEPETVTVTIVKKPVTASATVADKIYDGTTDIDASAIEITFDGIVDGDDVVIDRCTGLFLNANAGNNKTVQIAYYISGDDVDNYEIYEDYVTVPENEYYFIETKANILSRDIADAQIVLGDVLVYNGADQTRSIAGVTVDGLEVTYTVSGNTATNVGVYELTITANTNFTGTKTVLYAINPDLSGIEGLDQFNVKSNNKADIEYVYNQLDNAETDLASAEKKAEWNTIRSNCYEMLLMINSVTSHLANLKEEVAGYDVDTVTSDDYDYLEGLYESEAQWLYDFTENYTDEEIKEFSDTLDTISTLLDRITETKSEYERVIAAANGYDEATVTSADKDALVQLNEDIYALALTENVTAEEKENLQAAHDKVFALIDKLVGISDEIKRITEKVDAYVFESVKSTDKADIQQLIADIKALLDTQNLTADERTLLETADETCDKLIAKIDETVAEIKRINNATNVYDEATVTSADKEAVEQLIADIKALTDGDNITDAEREQLNGNDAVLDALLAKINATAEEIARIEEAVNGYDEETVKSTDKADLEQLKEDIKALTDATNITEDERTKLGELDAKLDSLIKKIDDTAAEIERIDEAVNSYDMETVTSADIPALGKLIDDIKALTDGQNITDDEKAALEANDEAIDELVEKLTEVAEEIKRVDEAVKSYDEATVKSTDKADLEQLKEDIQALIDSTNTTENEKTALGGMLEKDNALIDVIDEIEQQIEDIGAFENNFNPEKVTSDDKAAIEEKIAEIEAVNPDNLTEEQKAEYAEIKADLEALLEEIEKAGSEVDAIGAELEMFDEERVTIFYEDEIEALKAKIDELLADENMGEAEKAKLNEYKAQCDNLIEIINNPSDYFSMRLFRFVWDALHWLSSHVVFIFNWIVSMF